MQRTAPGSLHPLHTGAGIDIQQDRRAFARFQAGRNEHAIVQVGLAVSRLHGAKAIRDMRCEIGRIGRLRDGIFADKAAFARSRLHQQNLRRLRRRGARNEGCGTTRIRHGFRPATGRRQALRRAAAVQPRLIQRFLDGGLAEAGEEDGARCLVHPEQLVNAPVSAGNLAQCAAVPAPDMAVAGAFGRPQKALAVCQRF